jgi:HTH-type transcriptional regulator / antitoxin HipB
MKNESTFTPKALGSLVKQRRGQLRLTQAELAMTSGTGVRFISDLENGKETCQIGRILKVLAALGLHVSILNPDAT